MKVITTLRILMNKEFRPALKRVMEKWPEAMDAYIFVKIARIIEAEMKGYVSDLEGLREQMGFMLPVSGRKSVTGSEITDALLMEYGKFDAGGRPSLTNASENQISEFFVKKNIAETAITAYELAVEKMLDDAFELEIPRQIKITEKHLKKEVLTPQDCFTLEPILDLSLVMEEGDAPALPIEE